MRLALFYHSLVSDWNHGNAHFLRGVVSELLSRGHDVRVYEPADSWSLQNLRREHGDEAIRQFRERYPDLQSNQYDLKTLDLEEALADVDLAIVHEWNDHELVSRIGKFRRQHPGIRLLFHDTHHRAVTDPQSMAAYDLSNYDGMLAYGNVLRDLYLDRGWAARAWTWHEAADVRVFHPVDGVEKQGDLVWVGNWGDEERTAELHEFLLEPVKLLRLRARVYGVRYPEHARQALAEAGIDYAGWLPNFLAPQVFAAYKATVHVPRRPYTQALVGIPTIRVFEALACGIPLVCSPWEDVEGLFTPGRDYLLARNGAQMKRHLEMLINDVAAARALSKHGRQTILARHTCSHRVDELLHIHEQLRPARKMRGAAMDSANAASAGAGAASRVS